jgi:hypothetical protein
MIKSVSLVSVSASFALAAILSCATTTQASPIFSQMTNPPTAAFISAPQGGALAADDFVLGTSDTIRSVSWQGANGVMGAPGPDSFRINIYADPINGGSLLQSFTIGTANPTYAGGTDPFGDVLYNYTANLSGGFFATAGTRYWISIVNDQIVADPNDVWSWAGSFAGALYGSTDNGATWLIESGQANFALDNAPAVPEPGTLTLVAIGLAGLVRARKRSKM